MRFALSSWKTALALIPIRADGVHPTVAPRSTFVQRVRYAAEAVALSVGVRHVPFAVNDQISWLMMFTESLPK